MQEANDSEHRENRKRRRRVAPPVLDPHTVRAMLREQEDDEPGSGRQTQLMLW